MHEVNEVVEKLEVWINMLQLDKEDIERYKERSKVLEEQLDKINNQKKKEKKGNC